MTDSSQLMRTLTLQVTEVLFDFDEEDFTPEQQQEVVDYRTPQEKEIAKIIREMAQKKYEKRFPKA